MKFYFSIITQDHWTAKNNAHKEAKELAQAMSRTIIEEKELGEYEEDFRARLAALNQRNPKCNDLILDVWGNEYNSKYRQIYYYISGVVHLQLIEIQYITNRSINSFKHDFK